jgi:hypothetical protein
LREIQIANGLAAWETFSGFAGAPSQMGYRLQQMVRLRLHQRNCGRLIEKLSAQFSPDFPGVLGGRAQVCHRPRFPHAVSCLPKKPENLLQALRMPAAVGYHFPRG